MWKGPNSPTAVINAAHDFHGLIAEKWRMLTQRYYAETTQATWEDMERFDVPLQQVTADIVVSLKDLFYSISEEITAAYLGAFDVDLFPELDFLYKSLYLGEGMEKDFMYECYKFLDQTDKRLDVLVENTLRKFTSQQINWKHAQDIRYVLYDRSSSEVRKGSHLKFLVQWNGAESYVLVRSNQFYPEDDVLRNRLNSDLDALEKGFATPNNGLRYDWRTNSPIGECNFIIAKRPKLYRIEREIYQHSYLIASEDNNMKIVNIENIIGSEQLQRFLHAKKDSIHRLLRANLSMLPIGEKICDTCAKLCTEKYALCCQKVYCSEVCQRNDWILHKADCKNR